MIREARIAEGRLAGIEYHLSQKPKFGNIEYIRDSTPSSDSPSDSVVVASCAHRLLSYGCITDDDFYEQLEAARARDVVEYDSDCDSVSSCASWHGSRQEHIDDPHRLHAKYLSEKYCPMVTAARLNPRVCGIMSDSSDNILLNDPEFEGIRNQAMAFEKLYDMTAVFESYVDHVQSFPDRAKEFARGGRSPIGIDEWFE